MRNCIIALLLSLFLVGCSGSKPQDVAESFVTELAKGNLESAQKHCTPEISEVIKEMTDLSSSHFINPDFRFTLLREEKTDELLTVYYQDENGQERKISLKESDGKWKVAAFTLYL